MNIANDLLNSIKNNYKTLSIEAFGDLDSFQYNELEYMVNNQDKQFDSYIYFIYSRDNNLMKIGKTRNIERRIRQIKNQMISSGYTGEIELKALHLTFSGYEHQLERYYHQKYRNHRIKGEWFNVSLDKIVNENMTDLYNYFNGIHYFFDILESKENLKPEIEFSDLKLISTINNGNVKNYLIKHFVKLEFLYDQSKHISHTIKCLENLNNNKYGYRIQLSDGKYRIYNPSSFVTLDIYSFLMSKGIDFIAKLLKEE